MFEIIEVNGKYVMDEVDQSRGLQVSSFISDPARNAKRLRRLMQEEEQRAAEEEQPIVLTLNIVAWSRDYVMIGWIITLFCRKERTNGKKQSNKADLSWLPD